MDHSSNPLRIAIVGLRHGGAHMEKICLRKDMAIVGLCDLDDTLLEPAAQACDLGPAGRFHDYARMLEQAKPEAVIIATPVHLHEKMTGMAVERGIHVLLEKPMTHDLSSAARLKHLVDRSASIVQIGFEFRSSPLIRKVHQIIEAGELGQVAVVWTRMFRGPAPGTDAWRDKCGLFFDCMIHEIDGLMDFAGADFERLCAFGAPQGLKGPGAGIPHTVTANVEFANAVRGSVAFSELSQTYDNTHFGVVGDKGRMDVGIWEPEGAGSIKLYTDGGIYRTKIDIDGHKASRGHLGFAEQHDRFLATIREGAPNVSDIANGLKIQRIMAAFEQSMNDGRIVHRHEYDQLADANSDSVIQHA